MSKFLLSVLGTVSDKQPSLTVKPFAECRVLILFSRLFHHFQRTKFCGVRYVDLICSLDVLMYVLHLLPRPSGVRFGFGCCICIRYLYPKPYFMQQHSTVVLCHQLQQLINTVLWFVIVAGSDISNDALWNADSLFLSVLPSYQVSVVVKPSVLLSFQLEW